MSIVTSQNRKRGSRIQRKRLRKVRSRAKTRLGDFRALRSVDDETKKSLRRAVLRTEIQLAGVDLWWKTILEVLQVASMLLIVTGIGIANLFIKYVFHIADASISQPSSTFTTTAFLTFIIGFSILVIPSMFRSLISRRVRNFLAYSKFLSLWLWITLLIYGVILSQTLMAIDRNEKELSNQRAVAVGCTAALGVLVMLIIVGYIVSFVRVTFRKRVRSYYTEAVIIHSLLAALRLVEKGNGRLVRTDYKRLLIFEIDRAATCVEKHLPQRLRTNHAVTDSWLEETSAEIATGMRELIKWVITPKQDTLDQLRSRLTSYFTFASRGDWDNFERTSPEKIPSQELWKSRIKILITALLSSAVPIITLWIVKKLNIVTEPILIYLTVGGYVWAALTLLSHLDPNYGAKLTAMKDVAQLLPFSKKGKE